ncbi:hypothetical protein EJ08DRAFT_315503 [Tothia fuscella]|uniref:Store-operated calcium entry-associated regulatory factor n=1 Tax=Tothia fuscella TaxID=1048955 RepID=A0A9P4NNV0_9PEZI|nr:hypothetical protein EJ08DRAFT_315503 [Tothia fuscella]
MRRTISFWRLYRYLLLGLVISLSIAIPKYDPAKIEPPTSHEPPTSDAPPGTVLLSKIPSLTLKTNQQTKAVRTEPFPQLICVSGPCSEGAVEEMTCTNEGSGYGPEKIHWECSSSHSSRFKLTTTAVICEGFLGPDDVNVVEGSCSVEYGIARIEPEGARVVKREATGLEFICVYIVLVLICFAIIWAVDRTNFSRVVRDMYELARNHWKQWQGALARAQVQARDRAQAEAQQLMEEADRPPAYAELYPEIDIPAGEERRIIRRNNSEPINNRTEVAAEADQHPEPDRTARPPVVVRQIIITHSISRPAHPERQSEASTGQRTVRSASGSDLPGSTHTSTGYGTTKRR